MGTAFLSKLRSLGAEQSRVSEGPIGHSSTGHLGGFLKITKVACSGGRE